MAEAGFGMQLRRSRQAAALSLRQLATRVGYDHSYLSQVERGQRPGSDQLAQLCDRELKTGAALTAAYRQIHARGTNNTGEQQPAGGPPPAPVVPVTAASPAAERPVGQVSAAIDQQASLPTGAGLLEEIRHGLAGSIGHADAADEWATVAANHAAGFYSIPPAELVADLTADLQLLRVDTSAAQTGPAAQLSILMALTLTGLGRIRAAGRWWRTGRMTADRSGDERIRSLIRGWEATSGLSEQRSLPELLDLADEAVALAGDARVHAVSSGALAGEAPPFARATWGLASWTGCVARAQGARALILARLGRVQDAHKALQDLLGVAGGLPTEVGGTTNSAFGWAGYQVHGMEGAVCSELRYTGAGYVVLERALELCPVDNVGERAGFELGLARCLVLDGEVSAGLAMAMRVLVELPDQWHTHYLYDAASRVLSAVQGKELGRAAVRDYRELLTRRPHLNRSVGSGSSSAWAQG